jgi:hypothetical protein
MVSMVVLNLRTTALQKCAAVGGGLVFKAPILLYHSTLGLIAMKKEKNDYSYPLWKAW